ncbi:transposon-transfer assisting family protein [Clostridium cadaveris]|uniref:transposon-transfer assisting family protein n=1 Tax=Clostridium cadaveris TaxID=1529 RepID=UPI0015B41764|nr:transposon-transfer assisting family protein [Clostridium cadaveris]NWK10794.1 transposon-transfer assisting family protein [Clostridium cadaveris]
MGRFTVEESNLMCIYNTGSRVDLISELAKIQIHLATDETDLLTLTKTVLEKISAMSDEEFESLSGELIPDFEE